MQGASPPDCQIKLGSSRVGILGCGGIGNLIASQLTTSGVGKLLLVDDDVIELSNLTRQIMFTEADIGLKKCHVLSRELQRRNSSVTVNSIELQIRQFSDLDILPDCDLWILSADQPASLASWFNRWSIKTHCPFLAVGYVEDIATIGPFVLPLRSSCLVTVHTLASSDGGFWWAKWAEMAWVRNSKVFLFRWRQVSRTVSRVSTKRLPLALWVPKLSCFQITG